MRQPPQGESIWGTINTAIEIALDVYMIIAKDENGLEQTGIMAHKNTIGKNLSPKAAEMAEHDGEWLCYDEKMKDIPMFEVLQQRMAMCKRMEAKTMEQLKEIKRDGKLNLTDYFGECNPPTETQKGLVMDMFKVRNGIFFTQDNHELQFAVHEAIADNYMSPIAAMFGQRKGDYIFYDTTTCAIPLNELKNVFDEAEALIVSEQSLNATLCKDFQTYTALYNELMQEEYQIPETVAPTSLFLKFHLEAVKTAEEETQEAIHLQPVPEQDFDEETDFEIGQ